MTTYRIPMSRATAQRTESYGITFTSTYVYRTSRSSYPTRIVVWSNTGRPNPRDGQPVRFGDYGPLDGGAGRYLDPQNRATDAPVSVLISPESLSITASRDGTGHANSGQVWSPENETLRTGDVLVLVFPDGTKQTLTATFTNNGHGHAN